MFLNLSKPLHIFRISPLVSFKPGAGVVYHPTIHDVHHNSEKIAEEDAAKGLERAELRRDVIYNGLDPDKVVDNSWRSLNVQRKPMQGGYNYAAYRLPSVNAFNEDELVKFFDVSNLWKKYSLSEIWRSAKYRWNFMIILYTSFLAPFIFVWAESIWKQRFEPLEPTIPTEDYHKHYLWHSRGHKLDHHAYVQYAEARRTQKWRDPNVNPEDYIPPKYRNLQTLEN